MNQTDDNRPNPDELLASLANEEAKSKPYHRIAQLPIEKISGATFQVM